MVIHLLPADPIACDVPSDGSDDMVVIMLA